MPLDPRPSRLHNRAAALTIAAVALASLAGPASAAANDATPVGALTALLQAAPSESPLAGAGLTIDLERALDLEGQGVATTAVNGATMEDDNVQLKVGEGSKVTYEHGKRGIAGKAVLTGGVQLAKDGKKIEISKVTVDLKTGAITARVGTAANVRIGTVNEYGSAEIVKQSGTTVATLKLGDNGVKLGTGLLDRIDAALGTNLDPDNAGAEATASLDVDVDLARGDKVNTDLVYALRLDGSIDDDTVENDLLAIKL